jgi:hypothetical protein
MLYPSSISFFTDYINLFFIVFISFDFFTFGRNRNSFIKSIGSANKPTPAKNITNNHPTNVNNYIIDNIGLI